MTTSELAGKLESTVLRPDATTPQIQQLCEEAAALGVHAVCVPGTRVVLANHLLEGSAVKVCTVAGFPLGHEDPDTKRFQVEAAIDNGAQEVDVVLSIGRLKDGDDVFVLKELRDMVEAADDRPVKVILEMGLLSREEIERGCHLAVEAEAKFVKTATGFGPRGATAEDVRLLRELVGPRFGVKAAGGVRDTETARAMIEAGANRIGTSSAGAILRGLQNPPVL
jgi:deoxyribose-phosphate aldolase